MRILTIIHTPWSRSLGAPRVQLELATEWQALGCECEKFSLEDAFPNGDVRPEQFPERAAEFVRRHGHRFDVIDAHQTNLPFSKTDLRFDGLLVARSVGLVPIYDDILRRQDWRDLASRWGPRILARKILALPGEVRRRRCARKFLSDFRASLRWADLINVSNRDEERYVAERCGMAGKCVHFPFGLADETWAALTASARGPAERLPRCEVAFVGHWTPRKGSRDWWAIARYVRSRIPNARFKFLGTTVDRDFVLRQLRQPSDADWITVVPHYENGDLPDLLSGSTVGAFPSYVEGFGFGVLEMLAAGLPTVAYDSPGPREMLSGDWLVPPADKEAMAEKLAAVLNLSTWAYGDAAAQAKASVAHLRWPKIARATLDAYRAGLAYLNSRRQADAPTALSTG